MNRTEKALAAKEPRKAIVPANMVGGAQDDQTLTEVTVVVQYRNSSRVSLPNGQTFKLKTADVKVIEKVTIPAVEEKLEEASASLDRAEVNADA